MGTRSERLAVLEAALLAGVIQFELETHPSPEWTFSGGGLALVEADFHLLIDHLTYQRNEIIEDLGRIWAPYFGATKSAEKGETGAEEVKTGMRPLWQFFIALCHSLQEGENPLSATDAYWLGLVDEVIGMPSLPNIRMLVEQETL
ncbi:MAG: hypothetical protein HY820_24700 [Acidobacteria bacterium]|nr:hypothetical protein [Acidobacteriota bacterium]